MEGRTGFQERLAEGLRYERGGAIGRALESYLEVAAAAEDPALRCEAHRRAADVLRMRCEWEAALEHASRSAEVAVGAGLTEHHAEALNAEAAVHQSRGDLEQARSLAQRIYELTDSPRIRGIALQNLGVIAALEGDRAAAESQLRASSDAFREARYERGEAIALVNCARVLLDGGDAVAAADACAEAVAAARRIDDIELLSIAEVNQAEALMARGELEIALRLASAAMGHFSNVGNRWREIECLRLLGDIHWRRDERQTAQRCWAQALSLAEAVGLKSELLQLRDRLDALPRSA